MSVEQNDELCNVILVHGSFKRTLLFVDRVNKLQ